ncbi:SDR family NAD(P)-dependent oxidoreductase [Amycolatopsis japonica]|uniref:SDR family NAD(P)-dependent oxidoreductase n=1 Tax=Amycolatopsis japonica TaxID=208439 RepID=UPI003671C432
MNDVVSPRLYGAEGARELLGVLTGTMPEQVVTRESDGRTTRLRVTSPATVLQRHELSWRQEKGIPELPGEPLFPAETLVILDGDASAPEGTTVLRFDDAGWRLDEHRVDDGGELLALLTRRSYRHVRVLAALGPWAGWLEQDSAPVLRLHDTCFLVAKGAEGLETYGVALSGGAREDGGVHPYAGLFTGLVKALEREPVVSAARFCVVLTAADLSTARTQLARELRIPQVLPGVVLGGGKRWVQRATPAPVPPARGPVLAEDAVVLGAGTSRGIGMVTLRGLAENCRPFIHILGTNDLTAYTEDELTEDEEAHRLRRRAALLAAARGEGVPAVNAKLRRLAQAREVHTDLALLTELCGEGKVRYHVCDTGDPAQVRRVCAEITSAHDGKPVDLLLNFSGLNRAAELPAKSLEDFRLVRDIKVNTYHALKHALADNPPRRWVNAGSLAGLFGIQGETDYAAANDFLNTAAQDPTETTFGWGLWDGTTRSTEPLVAEALDRHLSRMPTAEGVAHFLAELSQPVVKPTLGYIGDLERRVVSEQHPRRAAVWAPEPETRVVHREFSVDHDTYLEDHLVGGHPTVPGMVLVEIAAQAAMALVPGRVPVGVRNLSLDRFVRVFRTSAHPQRKKIVAEVVEDTPGETLVQVRILTDVVAPDGTVLATDREHGRMSVVLRDRPSECSRPGAEQLPNAAGGMELVNPYQLPNPFVALSGIFAATKRIVSGPEGKLATLTIDGTEMSRWFEHAVLPAVVCDALAQVMAVTAEDGWSPVAVPRTVRRIDFYGGLNDVALGGQELTVRSTSGPEHGAWGGVFTSDGRLVVRIVGATGESLGYVHQKDGRVRTIDEHPKPASPPEVHLPSDGAENEPAVRPQLLAYDETVFSRQVQRWVAEPVQRPVEPVPGGLRGRRVLLLGAHRPTTDTVAELLTARGATVVGESTADWDVIADLTLTGLPDYELGDSAWREALLNTTAVLQATYDRWLTSAEADRFQCLTVSHGDGLFGRSGAPVPQPLGGAWAALAKNLMVELPGVRTRSIDLDRADAATIADVLDIEARTRGDQEVGYRHGVRHALRARITPSPTASSEPPVGPEDCVLISGGGRGVGFTLARRLAALGAEVVVTGRRPLTGPGAEPDDAAFADWRKRRLVEAAGKPGGVAEGRREVEDAEFVRTALANLAEAGDRIRYQACDVTDRDEVERLVSGLDRKPTVLVHNAATYRGVRFSRLTPEEVIRAVEVKVTGFAALFEAVFAHATKDRPLRFVSCAGTMSAIGGMIGHTAYAAGSGALSRLGLWTAQVSGVPVHTINWPTWERTGNIVHYVGAARYGSTMSPEDGTANWLAEMTALSSGESGYFGRLGVMARPHHLSSTSWPAGSPDRTRVDTGRRFLGEVDRFVEHQRLRTRHRWTVTEDPHLCESGGALSVPMLLEYILAIGDWVRPEGYPRQHLVSMSDVDIDLARLLPDGPCLELEFDAVGGWNDTIWQVPVLVNDETGTMATAVLRYGERPPETSVAPKQGLVPVRTHADEDLWCGTPTPSASLPHPALAAILAAVTPAESAVGRLRIGQLSALPGARNVTAVHTGAGSGLGVADGQVVLRLDGVEHRW